MTSAIPHISSIIVKPDGTVSREWYLFLSALLQSVGGPAVTTGGGIAPIDIHQQFEEYAVSSIESVQALLEIDELRNSQDRNLDPAIHDLTLALDELRNELAATRTDNQALRIFIDELQNSISTQSQTDQLRIRVESIEGRLA